MAVLPGASPVTCIAGLLPEFIGGKTDVQGSTGPRLCKISSSLKLPAWQTWRPTDGAGEGKKNMN